MFLVSSVNEDIIKERKMIDDIWVVNLWCSLAFKLNLTKDEVKLLNKSAGIILELLEKQNEKVAQ